MGKGVSTAIVALIVVIIFGIATVSFQPSTQNIESFIKKASSEIQPSEVPGHTVSQTTAPSPDAKYITTNPINLTQIEKISKFRSCEGHDFSGHNFLGQVENNSSMKHYVMPLPEFLNDTASVYAPFDGTVYVDGSHPEIGLGERGDALELISKLEPNAVFLFDHINILPTLKKGDQVKAGQPIGYAVTTGGHDFDLALRAINQPNAISHFGNTFDSVFNHMTPEVLAEYQDVGLTKEALFFSKEFRDAHPCDFVSISKDGWVYLKH